jgi:hypothetical protein
MNNIFFKPRRGQGISWKKRPWDRNSKSLERDIKNWMIKIVTMDNKDVIYEEQLFSPNAYLLWGDVYQYMFCLLTLNPTAPKVYWFPTDCAPYVPTFSDSSTKWLPIKHLFHHTVFLLTDWTFCIAVSVTDMLGKFWRHIQNHHF